MDEIVQRLRKNVDPEAAARAERAAARDRRVAAVLARLQAYQQDLADSSVRDRINGELSRNSFETFMAYYYRDRTNQLSQYTVAKELERNTYKVTFDGRTTDDKDAIVHIHSTTSASPVWLVANQSIYVDLLVALQQTFVRPELSISVAATSSAFSVDLDRRTVRADCRFLVVTLKDASGNAKLELGSAEGVVVVDLAHETVVQRVETPSMSMVFDDDLRAAAAAIADLNSFSDDIDIDDDGPRPGAGAAAAVLGQVGSLLGKGLFTTVHSLKETAQKVVAAAAPDPAAATADMDAAAAPTAGNGGESPTSSKAAAAAAAAAASLASRFDALAENVVFSVGRLLHADKGHGGGGGDGGSGGGGGSGRSAGGAGDGDGFASLLEGLKIEKKAGSGKTSDNCPGGGDGSTVPKDAGGTVPASSGGPALKEAPPAASSVQQQAPKTVENKKGAVDDDWEEW
jgi:hypothetical protein